MSATPRNESRFSAEAMIPEVLRAYPHVRPVLDRYGLRGCGGPHGPAESLAFFARAHGVDLDKLMDELQAAANGSPSASMPTSPGAPDFLNTLADTIYRRFFKAGVVVVLTAGALWGAWLLTQIGFAGTFQAISIHDINAHGHAQIFGWVGLFVMGFAYQAFPRMKHSTLWRPDLANMSFGLMVFGVFARSIGEPLFDRPLMRELAVAASFAEIAAIGLFVVILLRTFRLSGKRYERHEAFILASLAFFFLQAVYDLFLAYATMTAPGRERLLELVATYQTPLRDLQIHGFAMLMIFGVGLRMFPALFGFTPPRPTTVWVCFGLLLAGIVGESLFFVLRRGASSPVFSVGLWASVVALAGGSFLLTARWGLWARGLERDRTTKFVRAAVLWLHLSMLMLLVLPVYARLVLPAASELSPSGEQALAIGFSHAYAGAVRHAITVGFISLMILGMAAKVVPTLNGVDVRILRSLWIPFVLVNAGCAMRVGFQIATDFVAWSFPVAGVSGVLEVTGIAVWGLHLWRLMNGWSPSGFVESGRPARLTLDHKIGTIVEWFPQTLPYLIERGMAPLANPVLRHTMARVVSVRQAASHCGLNAESFLEELNTVALGGRPAKTGPEGASLRRLVVLR